jgi:hypothetical protein
MYARPRAEVEREIAEVNGWDVPRTADSPLDLELDELGRRLMAVGLHREQIEFLLAQYDRPRIERQLAWLQYRRAKNPAGYLLAAIVDDYKAPISAPQTDNTDESADEAVHVSLSDSGGSRAAD